MPLAACAGMMLAFWFGARSQPREIEVEVAAAPRAIIVEEPFVYTPESGVEVERFASSHASATVIVLNGVAAIPDAMDFSKYASPDETRKTDSTADTEFQSIDPSDL